LITRAGTPTDVGAHADVAALAHGDVHVVVDDRLLYLILHRFAMRPIFLPDLIVVMAEEGAITEEIGEQLLEAIRSRYRTGFIEHSLLMLKGVL